MKNKQNIPWIKCLLFNAQSIANKIPDLHHIIETKHPGILFITETWLNPKKTIPSEISYMGEYQTVLTNRIGRDGGGSAILVKKNIPFQTLFSDTKFECEITHIKLFLQKEIHIVNIYRPPTTSLTNTKKLLKFITEIDKKCLILCGDFNIPNILWSEQKLTKNNDSTAKLFLEFIEQIQLKQLVREPTRGKSILDLVLTTSSELIKDIAVKEQFSDHKIVEFKISDKFSFLKRPKIYKRDFSHKNFLNLEKGIIQNRIDILMSTKFTIDSKYEIFSAKLLELYDTFIPKRPLNKIIRNSYPLKIKELYKEKMKLFKISQKNPQNESIRLNSKIISRELKKQLKIFHNEKEARIITNGKNQIYKYINNKFKDDNEIPCLIDSSGKISFCNEEKCNSLAKNFQKSFIGNAFEQLPLVDNNTEHLSDIELNLCTILDTLHSLPSKNSTSPDNIPYIVLKNCADSLAPILTDLFRSILDDGHIPAIWQKSIIIPIYKKGEKTDPKNYRPISLTSTVCRVFERILHEKITEFLNKKSFFNENQFGFLKNRSTTSQLLSTFNDFYESIEKNQNIDIVYIDFAKAFDTVPIELLLQKAKIVGIGGKILKFLKNFLTNRCFRVKIGNNLSENYHTYSGVPQGSILGPLLFLIFINDLPDVISKNIGIKLYADDVKIYLAYKKPSELEELSNALKELEKWAKSNGLKISQDKCSVLHIGKNNVKKEYHILGNKIQKTECVRDLGILIDSQLSFNEHISKIVKNAYFKGYQILRTVKTRNLNTLVFIYKTYVRPQLEYATEIWNPKTNKQIDKIEKVQKFFTRIALKKCGLIHRPYQERLTTCNLQNLSERRKITDLTTTFKIIRGLTSLETSKFINLSSRSVRRPFLIKVKRHTAKTQNSFFNRIVSQWNKLPKKAVEIKSVKQFREYIKNNQ